MDQSFGRPYAPKRSQRKDPLGRPGPDSHLSVREVGGFGRFHVHSPLAPLAGPPRKSRSIREAIPGVASHDRWVVRPARTRSSASRLESAGMDPRFVPRHCRGCRDRGSGGRDRRLARIELDPIEFPGGNVTGVLFYGQVQTPGTYYEGQFTVPPIFGPNVSVKVELVALVNVSCGGASPYLIGADFNCLISLISGPTGGPTEDLLWTESFTGYVASNVSLLPPAFTLSSFTSSLERPQRGSSSSHSLPP